MKIQTRVFLTLSLLALLPHAGRAQSQSDDRLTQLQILLDNAKFGPGKIDGQWGEFTGLALNRYLAAQGKPAVEVGGSSAPAELGVDVSVIQPTFTQYTVTEADISGLGVIPEKDYAAQEKLKSMPYERLTELIAERYHSDEDYVQKLNPEIKDWKAVKPGTQVKVPNVERPFDATQVKAPENKGEVPKDRAITVDLKLRMLDVRDGEKLIASFPITPGSDATPAPPGNWKIKGVAHKPDFRRDESFLKTGVRSEEAFLIPPGPNSPVGVVWIALDKDGIGIHGTHDPDSIGRNASHGCVRLANWDIVTLAELVKSGMAVTIE